jgi:hypothetical protein
MTAPGGKGAGCQEDQHNQPLLKRLCFFHFSPEFRRLTMN